MWGLISQRKGAPIQGNPIFTSIHPRELAGSQSREEHTTESSNWGLCNSWDWDRDWSWRYHKGGDLRGFQRNEPQIPYVIFPQNLGCTKTKGKSKNQVESSKWRAKILAKMLWNPRLKCAGLPVGKGSANKGKDLPKQGLQPRKTLNPPVERDITHSLFNFSHKISDI